MNIQRFTAPTSREAMAKARHALGDSAVILSTRNTDGGFEVMAAAEETLGGLAAAAAQVDQSRATARQRPLAERAADLDDVAQRVIARLRGAGVLARADSARNDIHMEIRLYQSVANAKPLARQVWSRIEAYAAR